MYDNHKKFCCVEMCKVVEKYEVIEHVDYTREYNLQTSDKTCKSMNYCPWCGASLGKMLNEEYYDILYKEYKIEHPETDESDKVPPEFKTDEWWKKRGL